MSSFIKLDPIAQITSVSDAVHRSGGTLISLMKMIKKALGFENRMVDWEATDLSDIRYFMMKSLNQKASIGFKL